ncbi:MAG: PAS domain S-box protein [Nitrospina sp.]|jgi:PAS domain S-box-containing protein|nr:PAS domain S-box protein [Nitrospina sp.]MBT3876713.1 PAS domain S-box protein [Nitrospina sp.]MBT4047840.1 PAS domain S-box protein [Nitrospina sp.]MBT4558599.1 PAS domain S-box protein [Nitrospina sp.]MBT5349296.1 PAS domain S-box protein [Nitrospina sp.]
MNQIEIIFGVLLLSGMAFGFIKAAGQRKELQSKLDAAEKELQDLRINEDLDISEKVAELAGQIIKNASYKNEISIKDEDGEKIQQINEFLNNILNSPTNISIISTDLDRKVIFWNKGAERMLGYTAEEMVGKKDIEILYANEITKQVIASHIQSIVKDGTGLIAEVEEKTKSGENIWVNLAISPRYDSNGKLNGLMGIGEDITNRKLMQVQLNHAQKMESIGQMAAGIAHEINTPLQYIGDNARFLRDSFVDILSLFKEYIKLVEFNNTGMFSLEQLDAIEKSRKEKEFDYLADEIPEAINQSLEGIDRVNKIVQALKEFSHPGSDEKRPSDINRAINTTLNVSRNEWKYLAEMVTSLDMTLPLVPCYLNDFNQVMLNLIINAVHSIKEKAEINKGISGTISITTKLRGKWVEISVSDTGRGIPESIQQNIFDPFFTTKDVGKGTGQGLAIVHALIVKKHQGTIEFESEVGIGTTFRFQLPLLQKPIKELG